jgi:hypothetical protein
MMKKSFSMPWTREFLLTRYLFCTCLLFFSFDLCEFSAFRFPFQ